jgi:hypothetical protein
MIIQFFLTTKIYIIIQFFNKENLYNYYKKYHYFLSIIIKKILLFFVNYNK